jgi:hypothetical protein
MDHGVLLFKVQLMLAQYNCIDMCSMAVSLSCQWERLSLAMLEEKLQLSMVELVLIDK